MLSTFLLCSCISVRPPYLQKGDSVVIITPSSVISEGSMKNGIKILKEWGLNVIEDPKMYVQNVNRAGTPEERIASFQHAINDPTIKAIFSARGGYGAITIADKIDFTPLKKNPKWLIGYSDITGYHLAFNKMGVQTIHGTHPNDMGNSQTVEGLKQALFGGWKGITIDTNEYCIQGEATGKLVGGNLCLISAFISSEYSIDTDGAILFLEEVNEYTYTMDRYIHLLRLNNKFKNIKGVVIGHLEGCAPGWHDLSPQKMLYDFFKEYNIPVMFGVPCGHAKPNLPLYLGSKVTLSVGPAESKLTFVDE